MLRRTSAWLTLVVGLLALPATGAAEGSRWPRMTITPFSYGVTAEAQEEVHAIIDARRDLVIHHVDDGVPWPEAFAGLPYHPDVEANLQDRLAHTPDDVPVFLAVTPLNNYRNAMAGYWAETSNGPRPGEWAEKTFDDPMVITAYVNYCRDLIDRFDPAYFNFAIEANELGVSSPDEWGAYMTLIAATYTTLKREYPGMPVFVSHVLKHPDSAFMTSARPRMLELLEFSDWMAVSLYPYLWLETTQSGNPANLPAAWISQARDLAPDKPFAVAETGWPAESLWVPELFLWVESSWAWQDEYLRTVFTVLDEYEARLMVWFLAVDYDIAWEVWSALGMDPGFMVWRDTGLYDGEVVARTSRYTWDDRLTNPLAPLPPPTPGGRDVPESGPLRVAQADGGQVRITWDVSTCPASGYHLVWLDLTDAAPYAVVDEVCDIGTTGAWVGAAAGGSCVGVLVVSNDGIEIEGSHGVDSRGHERPSVSQLCGFEQKISDGICRP